MATLPGDPYEDHWAGGPPSHAWPLGRPRRGEDGLQPSLIETYLTAAGVAAREADGPRKSGANAPVSEVRDSPVPATIPDPAPLSRSERIREATRAKRRRVL